VSSWSKCALEQDAILLLKKKAAVRSKGKERVGCCCESNTLCSNCNKGQSEKKNKKRILRMRRKTGEKRWKKGKTTHGVPMKDFFFAIVPSI
jgi:hypothetical protein